MVETTIVTGGVLRGGLKTCQHGHTRLSISTLHSPARALSHLFVCLFPLPCPLRTCSTHSFPSFGNTERPSSQEGHSLMKFPYQ